MSKQILEDKIGPHLGHAAGDTDAEKKASQLASDVKYKVRQELGKDTSLNPAEIAKKYLQQLAKSPAPAAVKLIAKKKLEGSSTPSSSFPSTSVSEEAGGDDRVWIVVTDKKTGNTYRRSLRKSTAERKIAELRANSNIARVERTSYHPGNKDDVQGRKTASVKAGKGLDQDGDGDNDFADVMSARMQASGMSKDAANKKVSNKPYNKKPGEPVKEGFSNWREDLREVVDDEIASQKKDQIKEKNVENKITINPNLDLGERINLMGGELIEMVEVDEEITFEGVLDEICDAELIFLSNDIIEQAVEEFFLECIEEGYEVDDVTEMLIESLDTSLEFISEASDSYYDSAVETSKKNASKLGRRESKIKKIKDTVKKVGKAVSHGVGYAAGKAVSVAKKVGSEVKKGYEAGRGSDEKSSSSGTRKPQPYRYAKKAEKKPGLASRLGSALKSGLKRAIISGARAVSRRARNVARSMSEENIQEVAPPGFEGTVKAMKKHGEIDNPYALAWYMKKKGYKSHRKETGGVKEAVASPVVQKQQDTQDMQQKQQQQKLQQQKPDPMDRKLANIQKQRLAAQMKQVQTGTPLGEARAMGSVSSSDMNPKGAAVRASSGSGMTMTKAGGLGKSKSTANNPAADDLRKKYFDKQAKADRRAAARERAESGEDRVGRLIRSVQNSHYSPEGEMVDEATASAKRGIAEPHRPNVESRREKAAVSVAAVKKRQAALDKHEKKTGVKLDISRSKEGKEHAERFPGSRQKPKVKGAPESASDKHSRLVSRHNQRVIKHGFTSKEKKEGDAMQKWHSARD